LAGAQKNKQNNYVLIVSSCKLKDLVCSTSERYEFYGGSGSDSNVNAISREA
jgi:hypothetical protein